MSGNQGISRLLPVRVGRFDLTIGDRLICKFDYRWILK